ncbi:hypothetical protein RJ639_042534 [Escallonia herrerae]|uniref:Aminotransferase-like plant mobile domain-containing protein n=1 Tax=Escallonia herrerae TaxID=1293975 RepID=A0AA89B659_9ASTE|nr:hypothetical protein RJ639_042534 [Escallonia herrerae]
MVPPNGGTPPLRTAHFLNPTATSVQDIQTPSPIFATPSSSKKEITPVEVRFRGRPFQQKNWKTWLDKLQPQHESTWKKAEIYDAILTSIYDIKSDGDLRDVSRDQCLHFPWGEATITLEDMMVLGGYSVLGESKNLTKAYREACTFKYGRTQPPTYSAWMNQFMGSGSSIKHKAFLVLWLSKYFFPLVLRGFSPHCSSSICRDANCSCSKNKLGTVTLWAPFHLVQLWAWERFGTLCPKPNPINCGELRSARWHKLGKLKVDNVRDAIDYVGECFQWHPYAAVAKSEGVLARCCRASELVGVDDCIEQYLPHRVAMQVGLDQDIPGYFTRCNETPEVAWGNYNRPIIDEKLYIPPRLVQSDVTDRYSKWWRETMLASGLGKEGR